MTKDVLCHVILGQPFLWLMGTGSEGDTQRGKGGLVWDEENASKENPAHQDSGGRGWRSIQTRKKARIKIPKGPALSLMVNRISGRRRSIIRSVALVINEDMNPTLA